MKELRGAISGAIIQAEFWQLGERLSVVLAKEFLHFFRARQAALFASGNVPLLKTPGRFVFMRWGFHRMAKRKGREATAARIRSVPKMRRAASRREARRRRCWERVILKDWAAWDKAFVCCLDKWAALQRFEHKRNRMA